MLQDYETMRKDKERSDDRILVLKQIEGEHVTASTGLVDNRLFQGGNRVHGIKDPRDNLWFFKYDAGGLPEPLKQKFTSFLALHKFASNYFAKRGLAVVEVID